MFAPPIWLLLRLMLRSVRPVTVYPDSMPNLSPVRPSAALHQKLSATTRPTLEFNVSSNSRGSHGFCVTSLRQVPLETDFYGIFVSQGAAVSPDTIRIDQIPILHWRTRHQSSALRHVLHSCAPFRHAHLTCRHIPQFDGAFVRDQLCKTLLRSAVCTAATKSNANPEHGRFAVARGR